MLVRIDKTIKTKNMADSISEAIRNTEQQLPYLSFSGQSLDSWLFSNYLCIACVVSNLLLSTGRHFRIHGCCIWTQLQYPMPIRETNQSMCCFILPDEAFSHAHIQIRPPQNPLQLCDQPMAPSFTIPVVIEAVYCRQSCRRTEKLFFCIKCKDVAMVPW